MLILKAPLQITEEFGQVCMPFSTAESSKTTEADKM